MKNYLQIIFVFFLAGIFSSANAQGWIWGSRSTAGGGEGWDVAADDSGNVYVVGEFATNILSFGSTVLQNTLQGTSDIFLAKFNSSGNIVWALKAGGRDIDQGLGVTTDATGNVFVTGTFYSDTIIFGNDTLYNAGGGWGDFFLAKYDAAGNNVWARSAGGTSSESGAAVATDVAGNILATGRFISSPLSFGSFTINNAGSSDVFLVKYDANGNVLWAQSGGGSGLDIGQGVSADNNGNVFITGYVTSQIATFGSVTLPNTSANFPNTYVVKYDAAGNSLWGKTDTGNHIAIGSDVATDASGNCFATGYYDSTITFGNTVLVTHANSSSDEAFIVSYDPSGNLQWAKSSSTPQVNHTVTGYSVSTDASGNSYVTGGFMNCTSIIFDQDTLHETATDPLFIVKYDPAGNVICASSLSSGGDDNNGVIVKKGIVYVGGDYMGTMIVGPDTLLGNNSENIFAARYSCDVNSVGEPKPNDEIKIYPNPSNGIFNLDFGNANITKTEIQVYDVLGKTIYKSRIGNPQLQIDLEGNPDGIYFYRIVNESAIISSGKLILAK